MANKMNPELKAKWVAALRSGKHKQGYGRLCDGGKYCCLGVLAAIQGKDPNNHKYPTWGRETIELLTEDAACGLTYEQQQKLATLNDGGVRQPKTFPEIADYIEEHL